MKVDDNYQAAKKFWGAERSGPWRALVLDSGFELLRPVSVSDIVNTFERVLYMPHASRSTALVVLCHVNRVLQTDFAWFPMELPRVLTREKQGAAFLRDRWRTAD
mmetsp:Transcript_106735/g.301882  ORF Transcript_106735/g.301882 Transcript_106735/m.301882 type:complete len:105 (+) Transcript_106735:261-575(+)